MRKKKGIKKFGLNYPENGRLYFSTEETGSLFDEFMEEKDFDGESIYQFSVNSSIIYFYMLKDDYEKMNFFLNNLIPEINKIYDRYGLPLIEMK